MRCEDLGSIAHARVGVQISVCVYMRDLVWNSGHARGLC